jgi:hypothetical protein
MKEVLYKGAVYTAAFGAVIEVERMVGMPIREHLDVPFNTPFIYGSDLAPSAFVGLLAGLIGSELVTYADNHRTKRSENVRHLSQKTKRGMAVLVSAAVANIPIGAGVAYEMKDKCAAEKALNDEPKLEAIHVCKPDPVDAGVVILGGTIGLIGGIAGAECDRDDRRYLNNH